MLTLLTVQHILFLPLQHQQVPAVQAVVATDAVFPSARSTVMRLETTTAIAAPITDGSELCHQAYNYFIWHCSHCGDNAEYAQVMWPLLPICCTLIHQLHPELSLTSQHGPLESVMGVDLEMAMDPYGFQLDDDFGNGPSGPQPAAMDPFEFSGQPFGMLPTAMNFSEFSPGSLERERLNGNDLTDSDVGDGGKCFETFPEFQALALGGDVWDTERLEPVASISDGEPDAPASAFGAQRCAMTSEVEQPVFFWETDSVLKTVFCDDKCNIPMPSLKGLEQPTDLSGPGTLEVWDLSRSPKSRAVGSLWADVTRHAEFRDEQDNRRSMISNWSSLLCINLEAFYLSCALLAEGKEISHADVERSIAACLARKAASTLSKRSLLEAICFNMCVLRLRGVLAELGSTRVDGLSIRLAKRAGHIEQAPALTVQQFMQLDGLVASTEDLRDAATFGGMLVLMYACGHFSDGQRAINMILGGSLEGLGPDALGGQGFLEPQVPGQKGACSKVLRRTFLPLVAPIYTLAGVDWFKAWIQARSALELIISGQLNKLFLCRFSPNGAALDQELTSSEYCLLLNRAPKLDERGEHAVQSHSLETTPSSWSCKYGVGLATRQLLGRHLDPSSRSAETCARDCLAPAVRALKAVLNDFNAGRFKPDGSRSGLFVQAREPPAAQVTADESEDSGSDYVPGSRSGESNEEPFSAPSESGLLGHLVVPQLRPGYIDVPEGVLVCRNNVSGVQHMKTPRSLKLMCGRRQVDRYTFYAGKPILGVALCDRCMGSKELQGNTHEWWRAGLPRKCACAWQFV